MASPRRRLALLSIALGALGLAGVALGSASLGSASQSEQARVIPAAAIDEPSGEARSAVAVLAGGCFWGVQGVFQHVTGVTAAVSGYAGGQKETARYEIQDFLTRHPTHPYIVINDLPKVADLKRLFPDRYRETPVLVGGAQF